MKKLLLTIIVLLISGVAFAQKEYNITEAQEAAKINKAPALVTTYGGRRVYYDYHANQYLFEDPFVKKYGRETLKTLDKMYLEGASFKEPEKPHPSHIVNPKTMSRESGIDPQGYRYKLKIRPYNLVIGTSIIGASAATYMLTSSISSSRIKSLGDDLAKGDINSDEYAKKVDSMDKTKRTVGYVCAGTSLAGVIVVLTGLYREYDNGIRLGHNFTVSDYGAGISLTKKF